MTLVFSVHLGKSRTSHVRLHMSWPQLALSDSFSVTARLTHLVDHAFEIQFPKNILLCPWDLVPFSLSWSL